MNNLFKMVFVVSIGALFGTLVTEIAQRLMADTVLSQPVFPLIVVFLLLAIIAFILERLANRKKQREKKDEEKIREWLSWISSWMRQDKKENYFFTLAYIENHCDLKDVGFKVSFLKVDYAPPESFEMLLNRTCQNGNISKRHYKGKAYYGLDMEFPIFVYYVSCQCTREPESGSLHSYERETV